MNKNSHRPKGVAIYKFTDYSVADGSFAAEQRGGAAGSSEGKVMPRSGRGGLLRSLILPDLVAALDEVLRLLERPRGDLVSDVARQLAEEEDGLASFTVAGCRAVRLSHMKGPCVAAHRVIQPFTHHLGGAETEGAQEELLQLLGRVTEGGGVPGQQADGGDQRKRKFCQSPVELRERLRDFGCGEHRDDAVDS
jgi:hypothetical protein